MLYNKQFVCTYNFYDPILRKYDLHTKYDMKDVEGLEDVSEILYRAELMQVFLIIDDNWEENLKIKIVELFKLVSFHSGLVECMKKTAGLFLSEELDVGLMVLFSYDYFFLTHICVCEFLESGSISEQNIGTLKNIIFTP